MSGDVFEFDDNAHIGRLTGTLHDPAATPGDVLTVQADGSVAAEPGGGSMPVQASYVGNNVLVTDSGLGQLGFDTLVSGVDLLDRTDPTNPIILADGTYAVTLIYGTADPADPLTPGGYAEAIITESGIGIVAIGYLTNSNEWCLTTIFNASAGDVLQALVSNHDGASDRSFALVGPCLLVKLA